MYNMKKTILMSLLATITLVGCTSNKCKIEGRLGNFKGEGMIYVNNLWDKKSVIDSTTVSNGIFCFEGIQSEATLASLTGEDGSFIAMFFVEPGNIKIAGDAAEYDIKATGSPANEAFDAFTKERQEIMEKYKAAMQAKDEEGAESADEAYDEMMERYLEENIDNVFGLFMIQQLSYSESSHEMLSALSKLPTALKESKVAQELTATLEQRRKTEPQVEGSDYVPHYIDIVQPSPEGNDISLKSVVETEGNRYVLLDFWASWCGPCKRELPHLTEAYDKYHKKGFEVYGVSLDRNADDWKKAIKEYKLKWVNVSSITSFNNQAAEDYAVSSIPTNFLIDCSNGVIIAKNLRGEEVIKKLEELLK